MRDLERLPESISQDEANALFEDFLFEHANDQKAQESSLSILWRLSLIQWHTYTLLYADTRKRVEEHLFRVMDLESPKNASTVLGIALNLGIVSIFQYICQAKEDIQNTEAKCLLEDLIKREGEHPENPYYSLEQESKNHRMGKEHNGPVLP